MLILLFILRGLFTTQFGLHDLCSTDPTKGQLCTKQHSAVCLSLYQQQLTNITSRLVATGSKVMYVTTTPFMPLRREVGDKT